MISEIVLFCLEVTASFVTFTYFDRNVKSVLQDKHDVEAENEEDDEHQYMELPKDMLLPAEVSSASRDSIVKTLLCSVRLSFYIRLEVTVYCYLASLF